MPEPEENFVLPVDDDAWVSISPFYLLGLTPEDDPIFML